jgi:hypothetical protein
MASIQAAMEGARRESDVHQLAPIARDVHVWATGVLAYYGYQEPQRPDITSGYRSPERQAELQARWDRGDRRGLRARPASRSWHMHEIDGEPAALAWDVETDVAGFPMYQSLMRHIGRTSVETMKVGADFSTPDVGHFALPDGGPPPSIDRTSGGGFFAGIF